MPKPVVVAVVAPVVIEAITGDSDSAFGLEAGAAAALDEEEVVELEAPL